MRKSLARNVDHSQGQNSTSPSAGAPAPVAPSMAPAPVAPSTAPREHSRPHLGFAGQPTLRSNLRRGSLAAMLKIVASGIAFIHVHRRLMFSHRKSWPVSVGDSRFFAGQGKKSPWQGTEGTAEVEEFGRSSLSREQQPNSILKAIVSMAVSTHCGIATCW